MSHDAQDSRLDEVALERVCVDAKGRASLRAEQPPGGRCFEAFREPAACDEACSPTTTFFSCHAEGSRCIP